MSHLHRFDAVPIIPGDSRAIRHAADELVGCARRLDASRRVTEELSALARGDVWSGRAWAAFVHALASRPLPTHIDNAERSLHRGADRLHWFAGELDRNQSRLRWCQSRMRTLGVAGDLVPGDLVAEVRDIEWTVADILHDHRWALDEVAATFDMLDDATIFAVPPPSNLQRVGGALASVGNFTISVAKGAGQATWELGSALAWTVVHLNPLTLPDTATKAWGHRQEIVAILHYAWRNKREFLTELGKAIIDWNTLTSDFGRWLGSRLPDLLLVLASGGVARIGTTASAAVRGIRVVPAGTDVVGGLSRLRSLAGAGPVLGRYQLLRPGRTGADAVGSLTGLGGLGARLGMRPATLRRVGDIGALGRSDSVFGKLALALDRHPAVRVGRQLPGAITDLAKHELRRSMEWFEGSTGLVGLASLSQMRRVQTGIADALTLGQYSTLRFLDAVLVGLPAVGLPQLTLAGSVRVLQETKTLVGRAEVARKVHAALEDRAC